MQWKGVVVHINEKWQRVCVVVAVTSTQQKQAAETKEGIHTTRTKADVSFAQDPHRVNE